MQNPESSGQITHFFFNTLMAGRKEEGKGARGREGREATLKGT